MKIDAGSMRRHRSGDMIKKRLYSLLAMTARRLYNFRIDPELDAGLKAVKARDGISESEQIRRALQEWLKKRGLVKRDRKRARTRKW